MEKSKAEKSPWVKKTKKTSPKNKEKAPFYQAKKKNLAESNKGSWSGQTPSTSLASSEDPERFGNPFGFAFAFIFGVFAHYYMVIMN